MADEVKDITYYETALIKKKRKVIIWRLAGISGWVIAAGLLGLIVTPGALDRVDAMAQHAAAPSETDTPPARKPATAQAAATVKSVKPKESAPAAARTVAAWTLSTADDGVWLLSQTSAVGPILDLRHNGKAWSVVVRAAAGGAMFAKEATLRLDEDAPEAITATEVSGGLSFGSEDRVKSFLGKHKLELGLHGVADEAVVTATFTLAGLESVISNE